MITPHVWNALQRPPRTHRLFQLTAADNPTSHKLPVSNTVLVVVVAILTATAFFSREFSSVLSLLIFVAIPLVVASVLFIGPVYGLRWALHSARLIAHLRRSGVYELLCLTPPGPLNVNWMACTAVLYKSIGTAALDARTLWPARMFLIIPLVIYLGLQTGVTNQPGLNMVVMSLYLLLFILWFRLEDMQSLTLGSLLGMLIPSFTHDRFEVRIATLSGYITVQVAAYSGALVLFAAVLPPLYDALDFDSWLANFSRPALALALLWSLREIILSLAWARLLERLQAGSEVGLITGHRV